MASSSSIGTPFSTIGTLSTAAAAKTVLTRRQRVSGALRVTSGNFLEMYDFMVFGYYATAIGRAFFPTSSEYGSLLLALMTFGAGFLMRPLGALFLGAYIDRIGRRKGLIVTLTLMSIGTLLLACVPGYATIGLLAPILVLIGRLLQGFSAGVELGSASVYLSEIATPRNKGFYVAFQSASQQVSVVFAALIGVLLLNFLTPADMSSWGWRLPLLVGCSLVPLLFVLRRSLQETPHFLALKTHPTLGEVIRTLVSNWRVVLLGVLMVIMTTTMFYVITAYTPSFGKTVLKLSSEASLIVTLCVGVSNFFWLPLAGALSDRIGRRPIMVTCTILTILTAYPAMQWLTGAPSFWHLLTVEMWLSFLFGAYNGAMVVFLTEVVPPRVRTSGFSLAYSLATCVGGFTPAICTALISATHNPAMPGAWLSIAALCGLVASLLARPFAVEQIAA